MCVCQFGGERLFSSLSVGSTPMKMLIDDEVSVDVRHASPSTCGICLQFMSPGSYCDKYGFSGDVPHRTSTDQIPEFKDVFEVMESARMKTQSLSSGCTNICSGPDKVNSAEMNFMRQKLRNLLRDRKSLMVHLRHWYWIKIFCWNFFKNPTIFWWKILLISVVLHSLL